LDAVKKCREPVAEEGLVLDLDVQKSPSTRLTMIVWLRRVEVNTDQKWVVLYVKRWLKAPIQMPMAGWSSGIRATPQGGFMFS